MKAIVNVHKNSAYSHLNGLTFEVVGFGANFAALDIDGVFTDFTHKEIIICDFQKELKESFNKWASKNKANDYSTLSAYQLTNKIKFEIYI